MDSLGDIAVFVQVVESGSFTAAAEKLQLSKSVVSKYVSRLENQLGTQLLNRTTRRLRLTETGQIFYDRCRQGLAELRDASDEVSALQSTPRGQLRLNLPMSFGILHVAPALAAFRAQYPEIGIDINFDDRKLDLVQEGFDVAIRISDMPDTSYVARRLGTCHHVVCASPAYLEKHKAPQTPAELVEHNVITFRYQASATHWHFRNSDGKEESVALQASLQMNNSLAIREAVLQGVGITRTPTFVVGKDLRSGALQAVLKNYRCPEPAIQAVYPDKRHLSPKVRAFIDFMAERVSDPAPWDQSA